MSRSACVWQEQFCDERRLDVPAPLARLEQWILSHWFMLPFFIAGALFCTNYGFSKITTVSVFFLFLFSPKFPIYQCVLLALDSILNISASPQFSQQRPVRAIILPPRMKMVASHLSSFPLLF